MENIRCNLISRGTGVGDHMYTDKVTDILFPNAVKYLDISGHDMNDKEIISKCIKNQYVSINWIKNLIGTKEWKNVGKNKCLYEYFVDDGNLMKPNLVNDIDEDYMYTRSSGDMQYDFDDLPLYIIEDIKRAFLEISKKSPNYHWFEYSWSYNNSDNSICGCHCRIYCKLNLKTKLEWGFYYIHFLNGILKNVNDDYRDEIIEHIDWSCCSVTRGFAIPYNEGGVFMGYTYDENVIKGINSEEELEKLFKRYNSIWYDSLFDNYMKKFVNPNKRKELEKMGLLKHDGDWCYTYSMDEDWNFDENHPLVSGEEYNYNWRLSLVTTLMGVFNDKEIVKCICSKIYSKIKPYKQHSYKEMIGNELENKIFRRANFSLEPSWEMIKELKENWGLVITRKPKIK